MQSATTAILALGHDRREFIASLYELGVGGDNEDAVAEQTANREVKWEEERTWNHLGQIFIRTLSLRKSRVIDSDSRKESIRRSRRRRRPCGPLPERPALG